MILFLQYVVLPRDILSHFLAIAMPVCSEKTSNSDEVIDDKYTTQENERNILISWSLLNVIP